MPAADPPCTPDVQLVEGAVRSAVVRSPGQHVAVLIPNPWVLTPVPVEGGRELLNILWAPSSVFWEKDRGTTAPIRSFPSHQLTTRSSKAVE